jgi:hypothetical protein
MRHVSSGLGVRSAPVSAALPAPAAANSVLPRRPLIASLWAGGNAGPAGFGASLSFLSKTTTTAPAAAADRSAARRYSLGACAAGGAAAMAFSPSVSHCSGCGGSDQDDDDTVAG